MSKILFIFIILFSVTCMKAKNKAQKINPAKVEKREGQELPDVILTEKAFERLGVTTQTLSHEKGELKIPVSAILYDTKGIAWVYLQIAPLTFHRQMIQLIEVIKDTAIIKIDMGHDALVVTQGAAEIFGTEHGVGK